MSVVTLLRQVRERRGMGVAELAAKAGASRQTIYAIEAGTYTPNAALALKLGRALGVTVEELFRLEEEEGEGEAEFLPDEEAPAEGQPVRLVKVGGRTVAAPAAGEMWQFPEFDALAAGERRVKELSGGQRLERLAVAGCDPAMSLLGRHLLRERVEMIATPRNSARALELLQGGWVHVAGTHRREAGEGESNEGVVRRVFPRGDVALYSLAVWEQGLVVGRGNPKQIRGVEDLARKEVKLVNREPGAGSRLLLDLELARLGIGPEKVRGYGDCASGHLQAALKVKRGEADCCVAPRAAARLYGLDFVPLWTERYDLAIRREDLGLAAVERLLEVLQKPGFRGEMEALGGYDARAAGTRRK